MSTGASVFERYGTVVVLVFFITDVLLFCGIKRKVANRSNESVDAKSNCCQEDISTGSGGEALGFKRGVVDDQAADPSQEKGQ